MKDKAKYQEIEDYIIEKIQKEELKPGEQIETEQQLQKKFNFSHLTVNKALNNLANKGYITRTAGKGSFVNNKVIIKDADKLTSFTEDIASLGMVAGSKLIKYEIVSAKDRPEIMKYLELDEKDFIHYFVRLRTANDIPIAISYAYISAKAVPAIDITALEGSFKQYLESINFKPNVSSYHIMTACLPNDEQKQLLNVGNVALLKNTHITFTENKVPYEYIQTFYLCDRYKYTFTRNY